MRGSGAKGGDSRFSPWPFVRRSTEVGIALIVRGLAECFLNLTTARGPARALHTSLLDHLRNLITSGMMSNCMLEPYQSNTSTKTLGVCDSEPSLYTDLIKVEP